MDSGLFHLRGVLCTPLPFMVWWVHRVSLWGVPCAPVPQDTTSMGPRRPDPDEDISGLHLRHGVQWVTSHPPFIDGGCFGSPSSLSLGGSYVPSSGRTCGGSPDPEVGAALERMFFWFLVRKKNRSQKMSRRPATPKIGDFHFQRWWPISTCDHYTWRNQ